MVLPRGELLRPANIVQQGRRLQQFHICLRIGARNRERRARHAQNVLRVVRAIAHLREHKIANAL